jgi:hypothetical protein
MGSQSVTTNFANVQATLPAPLALTLDRTVAQLSRQAHGAPTRQEGHAPFQSVRQFYSTTDKTLEGIRSQTITLAEFGQFADQDRASMNAQRTE